MLSVVALLVVVAAVCVDAQRRFERVLAPSLCGLMLVLFALGMARRLSWIDGLNVAALIAVAALAVWALLSRRVTPGALCRRFAANVLTPGFVCFALACAAFAYATEPMVVWWGDDAGYWALEARSLWVYDGLVGAAEHLNPYFGTYLPGVQLLQWWGMHAAGEWREPVLYLSLYITYAALLLPLFAKVRWRHAYLLPLMLLGMVAFPFWGNAVSYITLMVDSALALCFGYTLVRIWELKPGDRWGMAAVALGLCATVLVKQTGILFAALAVLLMLLLKRCKGHSRAAVVACCLSPLLMVGVWAAFCSAMGLSGFHTSSLGDAVSAMLHGTYTLPEGASEVPGAMARALAEVFTNAGRFSDRLVCPTPALVPLPIGARLALVILLPLLLGLWQNKREMRRITWFGLISTAGYLLFQYASFLTVFVTEIPMYTQEDVGNMVLLLERYLSPVMLGLGMLCVRLLADAVPAMRRKWRPLPAVCLALCTVALVTTVNWNGLAETLLPERYIQYDEALGIEAETNMDHDWGAALEDYPHARVLVGLAHNDTYTGNLNYTFAPARFLTPQADVAQTAETLTDYLLENNVTHVIFFDDTTLLYASSCELTEDGEAYPWTLYEVFPDGEGGVTLAEF